MTRPFVESSRTPQDETLRVAIADPPYPGQSKKHYADHPDYAGEVDHAELIERLCDEYDGWTLHTASTTLKQVIKHVPDGHRIGAWTKPFCAFKKNVPLAYAWEPVIFWPCRKQVVDGSMVMRDWIAEGITMRRGLTGAKPERVVHWTLRCMGALPHDDVDDLYPGSGAVARAIDTWRDQTQPKETPQCPASSSSSPVRIGPWSEGSVTARSSRSS